MSTYRGLGTLRGYHEYIYGYYEYIKVFSTQRDIISTLQDFQYIGGISCGGYNDLCGGSHDSCGGIS